MIDFRRREADECMSYLSDYYAAKGAENEQGVVVWSQVPVLNGGSLITDHPEGNE